MTRVLNVWVIVVLLLAACGSIQDTQVLNNASPQPEALDNVVTSPAGLPAVAPSATPLKRGSQDIQKAGLPGHLGANELELWRDPGFKKQFVESYLAESEVEPTVTSDERKTMLEVLGLISTDKLAGAARLLQQEGGKGASAVFDFTLANIYFQQGRYDQAASAYQIAVDKFSKFRRAWRMLGVIYVRKNKFKQAIAPLTRVIQLGGGDAVTYGLLGFSYSNTGNSVAAESGFRMAILLDPYTMDWKMGLAKSLFQQKRFADAVALCDTLIADNPGRADLWMLQANAYIGLQKPLKAAENLELVDRLGGSTANSLFNLGDIYSNVKLFGLSVQAYLRALKRDKLNNPARAIRAARFMSANGALDEMKVLLDGIESMQGERLGTEDRKQIYHLRVRLAVAKGAGGKEARLLEKIVQLDPLDGAALILLGQYNRRVGKTEQAVFYFERAERIEAFEADAKVRHAQLLVGQGKYATALPLLRRAQALKPRENIRKYLEQVERVARVR